MFAIAKCKNGWIVSPVPLEMGPGLLDRSYVFLDVPSLIEWLQNTCNAKVAADAKKGARDG